VTPVLVRTTAALAAARAALRPPVVLVPTMGALHAGHRALLRHASLLCGVNGSPVVSVFVNPLQFGAGEDLDRYPRRLDDDLAVCAAEGAALVFAPDAGQMYPDGGPRVTVRAGPMGDVLEGAFRPGFFDGVLTVVLKLFNLVRPDVAVFGEKDAQQLAMVRRMVADMNVPIEIASVPTVRDPDGLALSSRNAYLSPAERASALALPRALEAGRAAAEHGTAAVLAAARSELAAAGPALSADYLALADPGTFAEVGDGYAGDALLLVAARVGTTRLIDNGWLSVGRSGAGGPGAGGSGAGGPRARRPGAGGAP